VPTEMMDVKVNSLATLYKLFCTLRSEVPLPINYLTIMIKMIFNSLTSKLPQVINITIQYTNSIFTLDYRGLLVLIPPYIKQIKKILTVNIESPDIVKSSAITILGSLIAFPNHYREYKIPLLENPGEFISMEKVQDDIYEILSEFLKRANPKVLSDNSGLRIINKAICCATIIIYQEAIKEITKSQFNITVIYNTSIEFP